ncbi:MAG TPA: hypothetical protein VMB51_14090 [Solirubrobacteraceae bacterium]|nr:hypothetical protein [Solirubrobacteraceae bacterium]
MSAKRIMIAGLCIVAALAMSAAAAATASATAPEYGRCLKAEKNAKKEYNGSFSDSKCTKEVPAGERAKKGKYLWDPGAGKAKFTSTGGAGVLTTVGGSSVECKAESSTGEFVPGNDKEEAGIVVTFTGCKSLSLPCTSPGAKAGELTTNQLEGIVGWESKAAKKTDLELYPAKSVKSGQFIEFECSGLAVKVSGKVLVPIKNDKMTQTETLKFKATKGKQKPEKWEESPEKAVLEASFSNFKGGVFEQAGQDITSTVTGEEKLELNAVI